MERILLVKQAQIGEKNENWKHQDSILRDDWREIIAVLSLDPGKGVLALGPTVERYLVWTVWRGPHRSKRYVP